MALCYCLLEFVCWSKRQTRSGKEMFILQGGRDHPVKTLDNGMGQYLKWMTDMFGSAMGTNDCRLHEYISRLNPDQATKGRPYELQFRTDIFPASSISVVWDGAEVTEIKNLDRLTELIAEQWHKKTKNSKAWKNFQNARRLLMNVDNEKPKQESSKPKVPTKTLKSQATDKSLQEIPALTGDPQRDWPDEKPIETSIFSPVIVGKPPAVDRLDLVQFRGKFIKAYLYVTQPDTNPPPDYQQDEWLHNDCAIALGNHLLKEPLKHVLGLFQHDELALRDWSKRRVANAIWANLAWQEELPRRLAGASPRLQQIWNQECAEYFPDMAREKVSLAINLVAKKEIPNVGFDDGDETVDR